MKKYIATYVETSETCDGKARVMGVYDSKETAREEVREDMGHYLDTNEDEAFEVYWDKMSVWSEDGGRGCEWNIEEVTI